MDTQKFAERVAGYATLTAVSVVLDDILWPVAVLCLGPMIGGFTMFVVVLLTNLILIWAYDKLKKDVFALEALRELTEQEQKGFGRRLLAWSIRLGRVPAFIAISFYDPFLSALYMRKGVGKYTMEKRDWWYFAIAMVIGCVGWTLCWQGVIVTIRAFLVVI